MTYLAVIGAFILLASQPLQETGILNAARAGDLDTVERILDADPAQIAAVDTAGYTPLHLAAAYARWDVLDFLLERGAEVNAQALNESTPLHSAGVYNETRIVEKLLERGAESSLEVGDLYGPYTPLLRAAQSGALEVVSLLLARGADPSPATREGWTALHLAALGGHPELFPTLLAGGVPADALDEQGRTYEDCLLDRPTPISLESGRLDDYVGSYGPFVSILREGDQLWLDDHTLDAIYPIGEDVFFCRRNPWKITFLRSEEGEIARAELTFLRRSVVVEKTK